MEDWSYSDIRRNRLSVLSNEIGRELVSMNVETAAQGSHGQPTGKLAIDDITRSSHASKTLAVALS